MLYINKNKHIIFTHYTMNKFHKGNIKKKQKQGREHFASLQIYKVQTYTKLSYTVRG